MIQSATKGNITELKQFWFDIVSQLVTWGAFSVETTYYDSGSGTPNYNSASTNPTLQSLVYVLKPDASIDLKESSQPWRLVISLDETSYSIWAVTPTQIIKTSDAFSIAKTGDDPDSESGRFSVDNKSDSTLDSHIKNFFSRNKDESSWSCFSGNDDAATVPLAYHLSVSDVGIVFASWAEGYDKDGDCFNWFVIQRSVDSNGAALPNSSRDPLFCLFSQNGGGSNDINVVNPNGILRFIVRESDVNAPTVPKSAVVATADSEAWMNPIQQVSTSENGKFIISLPKGLNTQRYKYDSELDMIAYVSADVLATDTQVPATIFGSLRKFRAINANHLNNKGMRLLIRIPT